MVDQRVSLSKKQNKNIMLRGFLQLSKVCICNVMKCSMKRKKIKLLERVLSIRWKRFERNYISWLLMKPKPRKSKDQLFGIFHKLNLEDAMNYITEVK